jgi:4-amino-4-deoxy-L-arabinose transferase-like glycosyltransferase
MNRNSLVWIPFLVVTTEAILSVFLLSWQLALGTSLVGAVWAIVAASVALCCVIWRWRERGSRTLCASVECLNSLGTQRWMALCFLLGAVLRLLWAWRYPAPQHSDHATYFQLARIAFEGHHYGFSGGAAFWPPGYPFFLVVWFAILGVHPWIPLVVNLALFAGTLIVVERLTTRIAGATAGKVSAILLAVWPTLVMSALLASKEMLVLFLLCAGLLTFTVAQESASRGKSLAMLLLTGLVLGYASLTQPSIQLFPCVLLAYVWLRGRSYLRGFGQVLLATLVLSAVIAPWTLRNHRVLGAWVPISTNGGDVFYRANNNLATGGYTPQGEQSLDSYDEVNRGKVGFRLGKEWIRSHPLRFLALALRKQVLFLGDDAQGAFETLKRGLGIGDLRYVAWKGLSNLYWLFLWLLILLALAVHWKGHLASDPLLATVMLSVLYLYAIHSVFESGAKYHQPLVGFLTVLAALAFVRPAATRQNGVA